MITKDYNFARYVPGQAAGHYESFFQRANHPSRPLAFWIRYTLFSPEGAPDRALGELWAVWFDGETGRHVAVKQEHPIASCEFRRDGFGARIGEASLADGVLRGEARHGGHALRWDLTYVNGQSPLFLLPANRYSAAFPRAKSLVGVPQARFSGRLTVNGEERIIDGWRGSQNHNWGRRHTDRYAWGQVAGFDSHPETFLEVASARVKVGPMWSPLFTPLVLRHAGRERALNGAWHSLARAQGTFGYFDWSFHSQDGEVRIDGRITAPREAFVGLRYHNPPGGAKCCLNSKIAACTLTLRDRRSRTVETLACRDRAAFEILTDDFNGHGVAIRA